MFNVAWTIARGAFFVLWCPRVGLIRLENNGEFPANYNIIILQMETVSIRHIIMHGFTRRKLD